MAKIVLIVTLDKNYYKVYKIITSVISNDKYAVYLDDNLNFNYVYVTAKQEKQLRELLAHL